MIAKKCYPQKTTFRENKQKENKKEKKWRQKLYNVTHTDYVIMKGIESFIIYRA